MQLPQNVHNPSYPVVRTLIIEKKQIEKIKFKKNEIDIIKVKVYPDYLRNDSLTEDEIKSEIDKSVFEYIDKDYSFMYRNFCVGYYQYKNKIQYFIGEGSLHKSGFEVYSRNIIFSESILESKYFESPFDEFESFFKSLIE